MARICVFGDSTAWGSWDPDGGGWVGRLRRDGCYRQDLLGNFHAVFNLGIPGNRLADVSARIDSEARAFMPAAIVLAIGTNDVPMSEVPGTPLDEFAIRYADLVRSAKRLTIDVAVITPTNVDDERHEYDHSNENLEPLVRIIEDVASAERVPCVNVFGLMTSEDLEADGLHPGPDGHQKLYEAIAPTIFGLRSLRA